MNALKNIKIELTSKCNQSCVKCPRTILKGTYNEVDISLDHIQTICEAQPEKIIFMGNLGDPVYHSQFREVIHLTDRYNIPFSVYTSGSGFKKAWWKDIYNSYNTENGQWFFDIDGTEKTAGTYRVGLSFEESFTAMSLGASMNKNITWIFPVLRHNQNEIQKANDLANELGIGFRANYRVSNQWTWDKNDPWKPI